MYVQIRIFKLIKIQSVKFVELIRLWCTRIFELDINLFQGLIPMFDSIES